jgi:hypothetical protein
MGRLPENVYEEYVARRSGILRALTTDVSAVRFGSAASAAAVFAAQTALGQITHSPCFGPLQVDAFFAQCDPERENLCLYGQPDGSWVVSVSARGMSAQHLG